MRRSLGFALFLMFTLSLAPTLLHAQDVAAVTGVVTDTSGALIVGADVSLLSTTTSVTYHAKTNSLGSYTIVNVAPGPGYKITISQSGFQPAVVTNIYLTVATTRTQDAKLRPGDVATSVEVSAANSEVTIDTTDATVGNNFDVQLLNDLPVQIRDTPSTLFTLQPGIAASSVTGARTDQSDVTVDGLDVNDISTGQTFLIVANAPVDSIEEFRGTVAGELASSGPGGGGQFQLVTKSGTNSWHGNVNLYHRDTSTVANSWFNDEFGVPLAHYVRNQFGGNVGGPILKDKAFFFFNFFDLRRATSSSVESTVPTDVYRNGGIAYINNSTDPATGQPCSFTSRSNTTPQCIGTLTPAQVKSLDPAGIGFSSVVQGFLTSRYPHANDLTVGDGINTAGYRFNAPNPEYETNYVGRFDYNISPTHEGVRETWAGARGFRRVPSGVSHRPGARQSVHGSQLRLCDRPYLDLGHHQGELVLLRRYDREVRLPGDLRSQRDHGGDDRRSTPHLRSWGIHILNRSPRSAGCLFPWSVTTSAGRRVRTAWDLAGRSSSSRRRASRYLISTF